MPRVNFPMPMHEVPEDPPPRSRAALLWAVAGSAGLLALAGVISGEVDREIAAGPRTSGLLSRAAAGMAAQRGIRFQAGPAQALEIWDAEFNASVAQANAEVDNLPGAAKVIQHSSRRFSRCWFVF